MDDKNGNSLITEATGNEQSQIDEFFVLDEDFEIEKIDIEHQGVEAKNNII